MNREEAIEMWVIPALKNTWNEKKCNEVLEALEQDPVFFSPCKDCNTKMDEIRRAYDKLQEQESCDDAISLEAVKNTMFMVQRTAFISDNEFYRTMDLLMRLPPVTPVEKVGHCEDCVSRKAVLDLCDSKDAEYKVCHFKEDVECLPPVQPKQGKSCATCKHYGVLSLDCGRCDDEYSQYEPKHRTGYISIDDVMSVFDDFMCGEVDEDGTDTFLEMLKDKAESEVEE